MDTIQNILSESIRGKDYYILLGDFLDAFYRAGQEEKQLMISEAPAGDALKAKAEQLCYTAAAVHKLANDHNMSVPKWVFEKRYYLAGAPFFGCGAKGNLRLLFMYKSPAEFKHRNLFVDENVLVRV